MNAPRERPTSRARGWDPKAVPTRWSACAGQPRSAMDRAIIGRAVDRLAQRHDIRAAFLSLGGAADAAASTDIIRACTSNPVLLPECTLAKTASILRGARVVVGMRFHSLVLAARYAVPFLAIAYDPKVSALCEDRSIRWRRSGASASGAPARPRSTIWLTGW